MKGEADSPTDHSMMTMSSPLSLPPSPPSPFLLYPHPVVIANYLDQLAKVVNEAGVPHYKIYSHVAGRFGDKEPFAGHFNTLKAGGQ